MNRDELIKRLEELDPSDDYHADEAEELDARSYYAAIDRAIRFVKGELVDWTDPPKPAHEARKPDERTMIGRP